MNGKKKFITCDGNYAAAHIAYMFSELLSILSLLRQIWLNMWTSGLLSVKKISSEKQLKSLKCSRRVVLPAQYTVLYSRVL